MNKLGSEFLKQFDNYERPVAFGMTKRLLVMMLGIGIVVSLTITISIMGLSDILCTLWRSSLPLPLSFTGLGFDEAVKDKVMFNLKSSEASFYYRI